MTEFKHPPKKHQSPKCAKSQQSRHSIQSSCFRLWSGRSLILGLTCVTGLGLLSNRVIGADEFSVPVEAEPVEAPFPAAPEPAVEPFGLEPEPALAPEPEYIEPEYIEPEPLTETYVEPEPVFEEPIAEPEYIPEDNYYAEPIAPEIPSIVPPPEQEIVLPEVNSPANAYIDPSDDYQIGATETYESPSTVVFSERSTGCEASVALGQDPGNLCVPSYQPPVYQAGVETPLYNPNLYNPNLANSNNPADPNQNLLIPPNYPVISNGFVANSNPEAAYNPPEGYAWQSEPVASSDYYGTYSSDVPITGYSPVAVGPMVVSSMSNSGLTYYNRTQRPASVAGNGDASIIFPLAIPAPITSLFGWRSHPVLGYGRFHTGIDIGADEGTPVVASYSGQVTIADWLGGYGLTVVLDHQKKSQESLYAHLSELFVKPGESVKQGDVIGRVGSTGLSTGPHLHFELRKLTSQGWVAIDPRNDIEVALAQLLNTMKVAEVPSQAFIAQLSQQTKDNETGLPKLPPLPPGVDIMIPNLEPPTVNFGFVENVKNTNTQG